MADQWKRVGLRIIMHMNLFVPVLRTASCYSGLPKWRTDCLY
jgi:hypothetical protein